MSRTKITRILFGSNEINTPLQCYQVGLLGCKEIKENHLGFTGGIEICNYTVLFKDGSVITIDNAFYVIKTY